MSMRRRTIAGAVATAGATSLAIAAPATATAVRQPDIAAAMRQFHENYNRNEIDRSGSLVVDDVFDVNTFHTDPASQFEAVSVV